MKKAFSLIELIFVMLLLGAILLLCMVGFSSQFQKLQHKISKESFLTAYQQAFTKNLTSAIQMGKPYTGMIIDFSQSVSGFSVQYLGSGELQSVLAKADFIYLDPHLQILHIWTSPFTYDLGEVSSLQFSLSPYKFSCLVGDKKDVKKSSSIVITTLIRDRQPYCFMINSTMCRLVEVPCKCERVPGYEVLFNC